MLIAAVARARRALRFSPRRADAEACHLRRYIHPHASAFFAEPAADASAADDIDAALLLFLATPLFAAAVAAAILMN